MKRIVPLLSFALLALALACSSPTPELKDVAFARLPKALEQAMVEDLGLPGGAEIVSPEILYSCDSLCIIHFTAVAKAPEADGYSFPVRYVFLQDMVLSHAYGHPVYAEKLSGSPEMTPEDIQQTKAEYQRDARKAYAYYSSTANVIDPKDL
jgi:hypothetical protein